MEFLSMVMREKRRKIVLAAGLVLALFMYSSKGNKARAQLALKEQSREIVFASDTQAPMWIESVFLKKNNNLKATEALFSHVFERRPEALFLLGDVVNLGFKENRWQSVDPFLAKMKDDSIPVYACLGNHELMSRPRSGELQFQKRFPEHVRTGYSILVDSIAIVLLNSNFDHLSDVDIAAQKKWYEAEIAKLEENDAVKVIIAGCHHSPFTNSKMVGASKEVRENFLPAFFASSKCKLFVSGHAHVFEHFKNNGKDFVTIGGGGGLTHPLTKKEKRFEDLCCEYKPAFHYLTVSLSGSMLQVLSHSINDSFSGFESGYTIEIPFEHPAARR
jgi:predicted MPP superfamily phosphohydrolase